MINFNTDYTKPQLGFGNKAEKLLHNVLHGKTPPPFRETIKVLEHQGFRQAHLSKSSHVVYTGPGGRTITLSAHKPGAGTSYGAIRLIRKTFKEMGIEGK